MDKIKQAEKRNSSASEMKMMKRGTYKTYFMGLSVLMLAPVLFSFYFQAGTSPEVQKMQQEAVQREREEGALLLSEEMRN